MRGQLNVALSRDLAGIKLNADKTFLFRIEVEDLGRNGRSLIPAYVLKIVEWTTQSTWKDLAEFLGFSGYNLEFLPGFPKMTANLMR